LTLEHDESVALEFIVVDNKSTDATRAGLRSRKSACR
jgi:GT2 family glycosyltransferase